MGAYRRRSWPSFAPIGLDIHGNGHFGLSGASHCAASMCVHAVLNHAILRSFHGRACLTHLHWRPSAITYLTHSPTHSLGRSFHARACLTLLHRPSFTLRLVSGPVRCLLVAPLATRYSHWQVSLAYPCVCQGSSNFGASCFFIARLSDSSANALQPFVYFFCTLLMLSGLA